MKHAEAQESLAQLAALEAQRAERALTEDESWEWAKLVAELRPPNEGRAAMETLLATWPAHAPAQFALGTLLLKEEDENGIARIQAAMAADADFVLPGCEVLYNYYKERGRDAEAAPLLHAGEARAEVLMQANREASTVTKTDRYLPHELPPDLVTALAARFADDKEVQGVFVVRKYIPAQPERLCHVVAVKPKFGLLLDENETVSKLVARSVARLPDDREMLTVIMHKDTAYVEAMVQAVPGSQVYQRAK